MSGPPMKIKLNTSQTAPSPSLATPATPSSAGLKLTFSKSHEPKQDANHESTQAAEQQPKAKRKYTRKAPGAAKATPAKGKKRELEDYDDGPSPKKRPSLPKLSLTKSHTTTSNPILKLKSAGQEAASPITPTGATRLKIKTKAKPPPRPLGVGYDSECEDAEEDPTIEEHMIFRMAPGPHCDYIKKAIEERRLGVPPSQGGADVSMRFFEKGGRRAAVTVQGTHYAAILVDLPCVIETMKSWDRRGWWKTADISQMLLVTGMIDREDDAREAPLPDALDKETWQWPHGLTPPMYDVRRRRFRKRVSNRTIEAAEEEMHKLMKRDEETVSKGGYTTWEIINPRAEEDSSVEEDEDEDMFDEDDLVAGMEDDEEDDEEQNEDELAAQLAEDDMEDDLGDEMDQDASVQQNNPTTAMSEDVTMTDSPAPAKVASDGTGNNAQAESEDGEEDDHGADEDQEEGVVEEQAFEEDEQQASADDDDDDDDEEDDDDDDDVNRLAEDDDDDEDARERAQHINDVKVELANALKQIAQRDAQLKTITHPIVRNKILSQRQEYEKIAELKRQELGLGEDDEVDLEGIDAEDDA